MAFGFRKTFKAGPIRMTVSNKGITAGAGAGGFYASKKLIGGGRRRKSSKPGLIERFFTFIFQVLILIGIVIALFAWLGS